jgi:YHS domain-containing protein
MIRFLLLSILLTVVYRSLSRLAQGIVRGMQGDAQAPPSGRRAGTTPIRSVQMARDPICGTFVVPENAVTVVSGASRLHFCSTACRDQYLAGPAASAAPPRSRTA